MDLSEKIEKVHEELIQQEGLNVSDLPADIKKKMKGWDLLFSRLKKNNEDEKLYRSLQKTSIQLADKIQDFIENDYEIEDLEGKNPEEKTSSEEKNPEEKTSSEEKNPKEKTSSEEKKPEEKKSPKLGFGNLVMEKKISQIISENGNGRIRMSQLREVIGKEPEYPEQKVHSITLRKVFMTSEYRIV